jgi:hypothetical protein|tara:strand:- start:180 stop:452 length:273 start_codon:yes stop_codon:yes gene_type:complete
MEKCEMLESGKAYEVSFSRELREQAVREQDYLPKIDLVLCEIAMGECPYKNEGKRCLFTDSNSPTGDVSICNTDGLVEKVGLLMVESNDN